MRIFQFFWVGDILILRHTVHFKYFFLLSDDIVGMKHLRKEYFGDWRLCLNIKISNPPKIGKLSFSTFLELTYQLQTQFFQLQYGQNEKFQWLSYVKFSEFSKTGFTFYHSPFILGVIVKKTCLHFFGDTLYVPWMSVLFGCISCHFHHNTEHNPPGPLGQSQRGEKRVGGTLSQYCQMPGHQWSPVVTWRQSMSIPRWLLEFKNEKNEMWQKT